MTPHRCPICYGCGTVDPGFYSGTVPPSTTAGPPPRELCHSCGGTGIVWSNDGPVFMPPMKTTVAVTP